ncbi:hypothetical protein NKR19_g14 [Coniochaeta hoffmannii]|uniref:Uncharacterized protein n=1 Tax=Coniochaeta hoffmannii TaxID=91930 RepID=A0AA38VQG1_9PEZI|nr:hypothetical protein NKR19_g14 [Coniochaeta hoffmannii]
MSNPRSYIYLVQRGTALYSCYEDRFKDVVGVYSALEDANRAVRECQRGFMAEFKIEASSTRNDDGDDDDAREFVGFCWEDRGNWRGDAEGAKEGGRVAANVRGKAGRPVGLYWEFDDGQCWFSCGVECWPVVG